MGLTAPGSFGCRRPPPSVRIPPAALRHHPHADRVPAERSALVVALVAQQRRRGRAIAEGRVLVRRLALADRLEEVDEVVEPLVVPPGDRERLRVPGTGLGLRLRVLRQVSLGEGRLGGGGGGGGGRGGAGGVGEMRGGGGGGGGLL